VNPVVEHGPLIDAQQLARLLGVRPQESPGSGSRGRQRPVTLLDVRWSRTGPPGRESYAAGHIPGARYTDLDHQLASPQGPGTGRHPLPLAEEFQAAMRALGVSDDRTVVVYDAADSTAAARAWWLLRYFSHRDVFVLDGGYAAWVSGGLPTASGDLPWGPGGDPSGTEDAGGRAGDFIAVPGAMPLLDADGAAKLAVEGVLLDARAAARYRGEVEPVDPVAGHIPGAVSAPTADNVGPDDRFLLPEILRTRFAALGVSADDGRAVGVYCGSGVTAAHEVLALELAGVEAGLYVGSWSQWITDPTRRIATGE
jgi:thiosulfate/3-mercaptopyruvate sulfurtransferase